MARESKMKKFMADVALLSVTTTEFNAVLNFHDWKAKTLPNDEQIYDVAMFERDGKHILWYTRKSAKWV